MQNPQITFRSMAHSDALAAHVLHRAGKLSHFFERIVACHVVIERGGHHRASGDRYRFSIHVSLPHHEIAVSYEPAERGAPETAYASADRAFDETERQLEDWVRRQRDRKRGSVRPVAP